MVKSVNVQSPRYKTYKTHGRKIETKIEIVLLYKASAIVMDFIFMGKVMQSIYILVEI